jgi:hypothetical protein
VEDGNGEALLTAGLREVRHGVGVGGEKRCSGTAGGTSRRWQCHPRDRLGVRTVGDGSSSEPLTLSP